MNPGLVVKLHPAGPWRIGPDSGARNRVDAIYHSDTLYGAVTSAMTRLGALEEWLDATARNAAPEVCFSSCFPFLDEIGFVAPPRTVWPPTSPALMGARVRWKSARFVPLGIVQAILAGQRLDDSQWTVDGPSECLVPAGRQGPFRTGLRWNAAVDRLSGATERHSTACLEFRPGAGLWTVVSFRDDGARSRWIERVQAAFRWLADSGFGGERSRGWGRAHAPEFLEGVLPEMILGAGEARTTAAAVPAPVVEAAESKDKPEPEGAAESQNATPAEEPAEAPVPPVGEPSGEESAGIAEDLSANVPESAAVETTVESPAEEPSPVSTVEESPAEEPTAAAEDSAANVPESAAGETPAEPPAEEPSPVPPVEEPPVEEPPVKEPEPAPAQEAAQKQAPDIAALAAPRTAPAGPVHAHWLLSLFTPGADDTVDWGRGSYTLLTRSGRVDASGELKKQLPMIAEGSVVYAAAAPLGSAPNVAPDGFAHPVFRAGFALSIPLPEVSG